mgnify:CR=1 FL=1
MRLRKVGLQIETVRAEIQLQLGRSRETAERPDVLLEFVSSGTLQLGRSRETAERAPRNSWRASRIRLQLGRSRETAESDSRCHDYRWHNDRFN